MSNMIEVFYYKDANATERKTREFVFKYIGTCLYAVVAYLAQHYFFSIIGENLTTSVRRMMLSAILRNKVGWFDEEENNSSLVAARLADVKSAIAERISVILQNMTALLTSFIVGSVIEWRVALLILATFPLLVLANFAQEELKRCVRDALNRRRMVAFILLDNPEEPIMEYEAYELSVLFDVEFGLLMFSSKGALQEALLFVSCAQTHAHSTEQLEVLAI